MVPEEAGDRAFSAAACTAFMFLAPPDGPSVVRSDHEPDHFGNAVAELLSPSLRVRVTRDRGQIFVDLAPAFNGEWFDVDTVLCLVHADDEAQALIRGGQDSVGQVAAAIHRYFSEIVAAFGHENYDSSARRMTQLMQQRSKRRFGV